MTPQKDIDHGHKFPFDAPDAWWEGSEEPPAPIDWAHSAARGIISNLCDRRGIKWGFATSRDREDGIDDEMRSEIVATMTEIIRFSLPVWQPIETAPRDGRPLLLWFPPLAIWIAGPWRGAWGFGEDRWIVHTPLMNGQRAITVNGLPQPTHWMPLPAAPSI